MATVGEAQDMITRRASSAVQSGLPLPERVRAQFVGLDVDVDEALNYAHQTAHLLLTVIQLGQVDPLEGMSTAWLNGFAVGRMLGELQNAEVTR